jgi:predicted RNase H-like HicB family nuclease
MSPDNEILIEYDAESMNFFAVLEPFPAIGMGETEKEALEDLRKAAYLGIETVIDLRLVETSNNKGDKNGKQGGTKRE